MGCKLPTCHSVNTIDGNGFGHLGTDRAAILLLERSSAISNAGRGRGVLRLHRCGDLLRVELLRVSHTQPDSSQNIQAPPNQAAPMMAFSICAALANNIEAIPIGAQNRTPGHPPDTAFATKMKRALRLTYYADPRAIDGGSLGGWC